MEQRPPAEDKPAGAALRPQALEVAARGREPLAGHPGRIVGGEEDGDLGDVVGLAEAAERSARNELLLEIRTDDACGVRAFGFDAARRDDVDADLARPELGREHARQRIDRTLGRRIDRSAWYRLFARDRTDVDHTAA